MPRALAHVGVCDQITPASRAAARHKQARIAELLERGRAAGPCAIMESLADTTMGFMIREPAAADEHCKAGFDILWCAIA